MSNFFILTFAFVNDVVGLEEGDDRQIGGGKKLVEVNGSFALCGF